MSDQVFEALASPVRRQILRVLRDEPLMVSDIAGHFPISRPAISRHLGVLESAGLVKFHSRGRETLYSVRIEGLADVRSFLDEFWDLALARIQTLARP